MIGETVRVANAEEPIVAVPVAVPHVQVQIPLETVPVEVSHLTVVTQDARRFCERYHPYHYPSSTLRIEFYS